MQFLCSQYSKTTVIHQLSIYFMNNEIEFKGSELKEKNVWRGRRQHIMNMSVTQLHIQKGLCWI